MDIFCEINYYFFPYLSYAWCRHSSWIIQMLNFWNIYKILQDPLMIESVILWRIVSIKVYFRQTNRPEYIEIKPKTIIFRWYCSFSIHIRYLFGNIYIFKHALRMFCYKIAVSPIENSRVFGNCWLDPNKVVFEPKTSFTEANRLSFYETIFPVFGD